MDNELKPEFSTGGAKKEYVYELVDEGTNTWGLTAVRNQNHVNRETGVASPGFAFYFRHPTKINALMKLGPYKASSHEKSTLFKVMKKLTGGTRSPIKAGIRDAEMFAYIKSVIGQWFTAENIIKPDREGRPTYVNLDDYQIKPNPGAAAEYGDAITYFNARPQQEKKAATGTNGSVTGFSVSSAQDVRDVINGVAVPNLG